MILRSGGRFYKVLKLIKHEDSFYSFECRDLDKREDKILHFNMSGLLEAADQAFKVMKSPKDISFLDLDRDGEWRIVTEDQIMDLK